MNGGSKTNNCEQFTGGASSHTVITHSNENCVQAIDN